MEKSRRKETEAKLSRDIISENSRERTFVSICITLSGRTLHSRQVKFSEIIKADGWIEISLESPLFPRGTCFAQKQVLEKIGFPVSGPVLPYVLTGNRFLRILDFCVFIFEGKVGQRRAAEAS